MAVVLTYNAPASLERCLESIAAQTTPPRAVLVVDNDRTPPVDPSSFPAGCPPVTLVHSDHNGGPAGGYALAPVATDLDPDEERVTLTFAEPLAPGPATLHLGFSGILNDRLRGFYRSTFTDDDGVEHTIATTQMESTDARRAFPCWDEPACKATFEVTLVVEDGVQAYSNGPGVEETPEPGGRRRCPTYADWPPGPPPPRRPPSSCRLPRRGWP